MPKLVNPKQRLTDKIAKSLQPGKKRMDTEVKGFGVRLPAGGKHAQYFVRYRLLDLKTGRHKDTMYNIGTVGSWTVDAARNKAKSVLGNVADGLNPRAGIEEQDRIRKGMSLKTLVEKRYRPEHLTVNLKPKTQKTYNHNLNKYILPKLGDHIVTEITRKDATNLADGMAGATIAVKMGAWDVLRAVLKWAIDEEIIDGPNPLTKPARFKKAFKAAQREVDILTDDEFTRLLSSLDEHKANPANNPTPARILELLLLTGARRTEIQSLQWGFLNTARKVAYLPQSKTGKRTLYFSDSAWEALMAAPRTKSSAYVFPGGHEGNSGEPYWKNMYDAWNPIREAAGLPTMRIHDLRHNFAGQLAKMGVSIPHIAELLGHADWRNTQRYSKFKDYGVSREQANKIGTAVERFRQAA